MSKPAESRVWKPILLALPIILAWISSSASVAAFDAESGRKIANAWCSKCHLVESGQAASDAAPAFAQLAGNPDLTPDRIRTWLADPHPPMPDLNLSRQEIEAIVAYLESLRQP